MAIAATLKAAIADRGQSEVSRLSGVDREKINRWLNDRREISLDDFMRLAAAVGMSVCLKH